MDKHGHGTDVAVHSISQRPPTPPDKPDALRVEAPTANGSVAVSHAPLASSPDSVDPLDCTPPPPRAFLTTATPPSVPGPAEGTAPAVGAGPAAAAAGSDIRIPFRIPSIPGFPPSFYPQASASVIEQTFQQAKARWTLVTKKEVEAALHNDFACAEPPRALLLLKAHADAVMGLITPVRSHGASYTMMKGTNNLGGVTCYIDSLLIAMFSRMDNFQPLLYQSFDDKTKENVAIWLRLFVNLFRGGHLITYDIMRGLLAACSEAGWGQGTSGGINLQQDAAEFFSFISELLCMPLLSLRVDIAHAGRETAEDDHKTVNERLLYLPVPGTERDAPILLEECLELYFANNISVSRHVERRGTASTIGPFNSASRDSPTPIYNNASPDRPYPGMRRRSYSLVSTTATVHSGTSRRVGLADESFPEGSPAISEDSVESSAVPSTTSSVSSVQPLVQPAVQPIPVAGPSTPQSTELRSFPDIASPQQLPSYTQLFGESEPNVRDMKRTLWTSNNEVTFPAWMFLQLMPFYADSRNSPKELPNLEARQVAQHFNKTRPVLGFCLKRYYVDDQGRPHKNSRHVVVPDTIYLPSFVADDSDREQAFGDFKLVLESAVFHRGNDIHSGHYTSLTSEEMPIQSTATSSASSFVGQEKDMANLNTELKKLWRTRPKKKPAAPVISEVNEVFSETATEKGQDFVPAHRRWLLCDDLAPVGEKVCEVDFNTVFEYNMPYMLFYRMVALDDNNAPPPFSDSSDSAPSSRTASPVLGPISGDHLPVASHLTEIDRSKSTRRLRPRFLRRHQKDSKDPKDPKDYASKYREEKCSIM